MFWLFITSILSTDFKEATVAFDSSWVLQMDNTAFYDNGYCKEPYFATELISGSGTTAKYRLKLNCKTTSVQPTPIPTPSAYTPSDIVGQIVG